MSLKRFQDWMRSEGVSAACLTDPTSIGYLTGFFCRPYERVLALAVSDGTAVLVVPALERENAEGSAGDVEVAAYADGEDGFQLVREALGDASRLGVEKVHLTVARAEALRAGELIDCSVGVRRLRAVKMPAEIELLAQAAQATDRVTDTILAELRPGQTELEVSARLAALIGSEGCRLSFESLVQFGPNSALPHHSPSDQPLAEGHLVLLDFGASQAGYHADTTRMAVAGDPDEKQLEVHRVVLEARDRAIEAVRQGVTAGAVDQAARRVISEAGYGDHFIHRVGHGIGLEAHEDPSLEPGSAYVLEAGMAITIEPGVYIPGWGGIRIEDDVIVERDGARVLTAADRGLKVIATR